MPYQRNKGDVKITMAGLSCLQGLKLLARIEATYTLKLLARINTAAGLKLLEGLKLPEGGAHLGYWIQSEIGHRKY